MDHRVPKTGALISVGLAVLALITFLFLNSKFEGPDPTALLRSPYELTARFENSKKLPTKQPVLYKGISVGRVNEVSWDPDAQEAVVTFTLDELELHQDAKLEIGERSLLGDPYLNLVSRGSEGTPMLESGDEVTETETSVNFDEALAFLDEEGREHVRSLIETVGRGAAPAGNGERLNGTIGGLSRTIEELDEVTRAVRGQEEQIASLVSGASTVLQTIGDREEQVRTIVGSGRSTLDALASNTASLDQALAELPALLETGQRTLAEAEPLMREARPLVGDLRALAPDLTLALSDDQPHSVGDLTRELVEIVEGLGPLRKRGVPVLRELNALLNELQPLVLAIAPGARNLVPALSYLTPRVNAIAGLYALVAANAENVDSKGHYLRAGFTLAPGELADLPNDVGCTQAGVPLSLTFCSNAYPKPNDALDPQPFDGSYPRIVPCDPPPRTRPKDPCE
jgi:phospholipid/cholesterol/gamma-HCH transport system substrate-binding protein